MTGRLAEIAGLWLTNLDRPGNREGPWPHVIGLGLWYRPVVEWRFVRLCLGEAILERQLAHIAAGPLENVISRAPSAVLHAIEGLQRTEPHLARALTGVRQYQLPDAEWARVQVLQNQVETRLPEELLREAHRARIEAETVYRDMLSAELARRREHPNRLQ